MKMTNHNWSVYKFHSLRNVIDPKPQYQRGSVWRPRDKQLLIDSILRHFDIPKISLRSVSTHAYKYEVADGQQRLRAIWEFMDDAFPVADDCELKSCAGKLYSDLPTQHAATFSKFELVTSIAVQATSSEIRELFQRLQRGVQLSQPEIRNAIPSQLGDTVRTIATTHPFFPASAFSLERYKADDLVTHAFLIEVEKGKADLKAPQLRQLYRDYAAGVPASLPSKVMRILDIMHDMQGAVPKCIRLKWGFVDLYWVLSDIAARRTKIDPAAMAKRYVAFEARRLQYVSRPQQLLTGKPTQDKKDLFAYIEAFRTSGGLAENVKTRHRVLGNVLS